MQVTNKIVSHDTGRARELYYTPDTHGATIAVEGCQRGIILDFDKNKLRVFAHDENGEPEMDAPLLELEVE